MSRRGSAVVLVATGIVARTVGNLLPLRRRYLSRTPEEPCEGFPTPDSLLCWIRVQALVNPVGKQARDALTDWPGGAFERARDEGRTVPREVT